jgi:hypothetical protein
MFSLNFLSDYLSSHRHSVTSLSWAGYVITDCVVNDELDIYAVSASWVVPQVNVSGPAGHSSVWIGIGGQADKSLIQVGTEHDLAGGNAIYSVWYELLPEYAVTVPDIIVSPFDVISASIKLIDYSRDEWLLQISDLTTGQSFRESFIYNSTRSSGEWVVERPTINNQMSNLVDFGTVNLSDCQINVNGTVGVIGNFTASRVQMTNQQNGLLASVSPLNAAESGFSVSFVSTA